MQREELPTCGCEVSEGIVSLRQVFRPVGRWRGGSESIEAVTLLELGDMLHQTGGIMKQAAALPCPNSCPATFCFLHRYGSRWYGIVKTPWPSTLRTLRPSSDDPLTLSTRKTGKGPWLTLRSSFYYIPFYYHHHHYSYHKLPILAFSCTYFQVFLTFMYSMLLHHLKGVKSWRRTAQRMCW